MTEQETMITKYGDVSIDDKAEQTAWAQKNMMMFDVSHDFPELPFKRMYVNKAIVPALHQAILNLQQRHLIKEIKSFGGCWMPRYIRGYEVQKIKSIHSWGCAVDFNVTDNPLGMTKTQAINSGLHPFTTQFDQAWRDAGFECGIDFKRGDGMHYQFTK